MDMKTRSFGRIIPWRLPLTLTVFSWLVLPVQAATIVWDITSGDGATITDGTGTWTNGAGNWNDTGVDVSWSNATPDDAVIGSGAPGPFKITLGSAITAGSLSFNALASGLYTIDTDTFALTLNTGITVNEDATIQSGSGGSLVLGAANIWDVADTKTLTVTSNISGAVFGIEKTGLGTLILSGVGSYGGNTLISGGTLRVANSNALGTTGSVSLGNAFLELADGIDLSRPLTVLNGTNKVIQLQSGATAAEYSGTITIQEATAADFDVFADVGQTITLSGVISGTAAGRVNATGSGTVILSGDNTFTSGVAVTTASAIVRLLHSNAAGSGAIILAQSNVVLELGDGINTGNALTISNTGNNKTLALESNATSAEYSGNITISENGSVGYFDTAAAAGQTLTLSGIISGGSGTNGARVNLTDAGTVVLSGNNTFVSGIAVTAVGATLRLLHNNAAGVGGAVILAQSSVVLELGDGVDIGNTLSISNTGNNKTLTMESGATAATYSGAISIGETTASNFDVIAATGQTFTLSGNISASSTGEVNVLGGGLHIFSGNNSGLGTRILVNGDGSSGTIRAMNNNALGSGTVNLNGTGTVLELADGVNIAQALTLGTTGNEKTLALLTGASSAEYSGDITINETIANGFRVSVGGSGILTLSGAVGGSGAAGLTKEGAGSVILTNAANSFAGDTTVWDGTLQLGASEVLPDTSTIIVEKGVFDINGKTETIGGLALGAVATTVAGNTASVVDVATGGLLKLGGNVVYNSGTAGFHNDQATISVNLDLNSGARTFTVDDSSQTTTELVVTGDISSAGGSLIKAGAGVMVLSGTNSYGGGTSIQNGTVIAVGGVNDRLGSGGLSFGDVGKSGVLRLGDATGASDQTVTSLESSGFGTANAIVGGNASFSTLTVNQSAVTTYNGSLGGTGTNENNLNLVKTGSGRLIIGGTSSYTGSTTVTGGKLTLAGPVTGTTAISVSDGATLRLLNGVGDKLALSALTLGSFGGSLTQLGLNVGDDSTPNDQLNTDTLTLSSGGTLTLFSGNKVQFNLTDIGLNPGQTYNLLSVVDGGLTTGVLGTGDWLLGTTPGGFDSITLTATDSLITVTIGNLVPGTLYWRGLSDTTWNGSLNNWAKDKTGATAADALPGQANDIVFQWDAPSNAAVTTTLEQNFTIQSLTFEASTTPANTPTSVTIDPGDAETSRIGIASAAGLTISLGGPETVTINSRVRLGADQTWNVTSASTLVLTNFLLGPGALDINTDGTSAGTLILRGANGLATYSGATNFAAGRWILEGGVDYRLPATTDLTFGHAVNNTSAVLQIGDAVNGATNTTIGSLSTIGTGTASAIVGGGSTESILTITQSTAGTFGGVIGGAGTNESNLALVKAGAATLTLDGANAYSGETTVREGILKLGSNGAITGSSALTISANAAVTATFDNNSRDSVFTGGITLRGADGSSAPAIANTGGLGSLTIGGDVTYDATNDPLGGVIAANLNTGSASRTFTANDSLNATTDLTISGDVTATNIGIILDGAGSGLITGNMTLGTGASADLTKNGTGSWQLEGTFSNGDDILVNDGTLTLVGVTTVSDDLVIQNSANGIVNLSGVDSIQGTSSTSNFIYVRDGATVNVNTNGAIGSLMEGFILGDNTQGTGNLVMNADASIGRVDLGFDSSNEIGNVTGAGTLSVTTLNLYNGQITANLAGTGNINKDYLIVTLSGNNTLTGTTTIQQGTLNLDFSTSAGTDNKIGTGNFTIGTSNLNDTPAIVNLIGNASASSTQSIADLKAGGGPVEINLTSAGGQDLTLAVTGSLIRVLGTINVSLPDAHTKFAYSGPTTNTNGIVGAWLTLNDSDFASISGGYIVAPLYTQQDDASLWGTNENITNISGFSGTVADGLTINSLRLDAAGSSIVSVGTSLVIASGGILETANVGVNTSSISGGSLISGIHEWIITQNNQSAPMSIDSRLIGGADFTKNGAGDLILGGTNNQTGIFYIAEGLLQATGGSAIGDTSIVNIRDNGGSAGFQLLTGQTETIGSLVGSGAGGRVILDNNSTLTINQMAGGTFAGVISGGASATLVKSGEGVLTLSGNNTFSGSLVVQAGGRLQITGSSGDINGASKYTLNGGELRSVQDQSSSKDRLSNSKPITLNNTAGSNGLTVENTYSTTAGLRDENVGAITLGVGQNVITALPTNNNAATVAELTADTLSRGTNFATLLVRGLNLGDSAAVRKGIIRFDSGGQAALDGFEVGNGTDSGTELKIIPWMIGQTTNAGNGNSFVINVDGTTGLRPLDTATEYLNDSASITGTLADNVRFTASANLSSTPTAINSLLLDSGSDIALTGSASSMEITSGAILAVGAGAHSIGTISGITAPGTGGYVIHVTDPAGSLTLDTPLTSASRVLVKSGAGALVLQSAANAFTDIYFNQGAVQADDLDKLGTGSFKFYGGALRFGGVFDPSVRTVTLGLGGGTLDTNGFDITIASSIGNNGAGGLTKDGGGTLTLGAAVSYTGASVITLGTLKYGVNAALQTSANVVLNGGTLDTDTFVTTLGGLTVQADSVISGAANLTFTGNSAFDGGGDHVLTVNNTGLTTLEGSVLTLVNSGTTARNQTIAGTGAVTITGEIEDGAASGSLTITNTNTITLTGLSSYTGGTNIDTGTLLIGVTDALPFGTAVRLGTGATAGTLDLNGFDQTIGSLSVTTNSTTQINQIIIDTGNTLTINGAVTLGTNTNNSNTKVNVLGGGSLVVNSGGGDFQIGGATGGTNENLVTADFSGLDTFTADLGSGTFRLGDGNTGTTANASSLALATNNTIAASAIRIGDGSGGTVVHTLTLGSGTNLFEADTINVGSAGSGGRSSGTLIFSGAGGSLTVRSSNGTNRATFNMVNSTSSTSSSMSSTIDLAGHTADFLLDTLTMAARTQNSGSATAALTFDQGTLDVLTLKMASRTGSGTGNATATLSLGDSVAAGIPVVTIGTISMAENTAAGGTVSAEIDISGGTIAIGSGSGTAINMANAGTGQTSASTINITGGTTTVTGDILRTGGAGTENATLVLDGASAVLDMSGFTIGSGASAITFDVRQGTLRNLNDLNGGGLLIKTTSGTLSLDGSTVYTGSTAIEDGLVIAAGGVNNRLGGGLTLGAAGTSGVLQLGDGSGASDQTATSLETSGVGTTNAVVGGNAAFSTFTVNQSTTTTFNGNLGGTGTFENNFNFVKAGTGELTVSGAASYAGSTTVTGGKLTFAGPVTGTTVLTVGDGANLRLLNGVGDKLTLSALTLGSSGGTLTELSFNVGDDVDPNGGANDQLKTDTITLSTGGALTLFAGNKIQFNLTDIGLNPGENYNLLSVVDGGLTTGLLSDTDYVLGATPGGFTSFTLTATDNLIYVTTGLLVTGSWYWSGGGTSDDWTDVTNWAVDKINSSNRLTTPGAGSDVKFVADNITGGGAVITTLEQNFKINSLTFEASTNAPDTPSSVTINTGALTTSRIALTPQVSTDGLAITLGGPALVTINAEIRLGADQTWNVTNASTLVIGNSLSGPGALAINADGSSSGTIRLSGVSSLATYSGGTNLAAGRLILEGGVDYRLPAATDLTIGHAINNTSAVLQIGDAVNGASNTTIGSLVTAGTGTANAIVGGGTTDSILTVTQGTTGTFSGVIGGGGVNENNIALVKSGAATLILDGASTYTGGTTVIEGTLQLSANGSITGALTVNAAAGLTAAFDNNSRSTVLTGGITIGGADSTATPQITNTGGAGGITLGGDLFYDATNNPLGGTIAPDIDTGSVARVFTVDDSSSAAVDLTISGNISTQASGNGVGITFTGSGVTTVNGSITLAASGSNATADITKVGTGTLNINGAANTGDDFVHNDGVVNINAVLTVGDDYVADNAGTVVNLNVAGALPGISGNGSNGLYGRSGATIYINADDALGADMSYIILGDNNQGIGNLVMNANASIARLDLGSDSSGEQGIVTGSGTLTILSALNFDNGSVSANLAGSGNLDKDNVNSVTLSGVNSLTGNSLIREGAVILDFTTNSGTDNKLGTGVLTLGTTNESDNRAILNFLGNATAASTQSVSSLTIVGGPAEINLTSAGGQDVAFVVVGAINRTGGTLNLSLSDANAKFNPGTTTNTNGIVGAWFILNDNDFASVSGSSIVAATYTTQNDVSAWGTNENITNSSGFFGTVGDCNTINSLRFDALAGSTVTVGDILIITSGGILETANVGANASLITGGLLISGTNEFIITQNNDNEALTIESTIYGGAAINKNGTGTVILSGTNNQTGVISIAEGILQVTGGSAISDTSQVNIRDNVINTGLQLLASETIGTLDGAGGQGKVILSNGATLTINQSVTGAFGGVISGGATTAFVKQGSAVLTLSGNSTISGSIIVNAGGRLALTGGNGDLAQAASYTLNGGELRSVQDQSASKDRLGNAKPITLNNTAGGNGLTVENTYSTTAYSAVENVGAITLGAGHNVITAIPTNNSPSTAAQFLAASISQGSNHSTLLVRGLNLGAASGTRRGMVRSTAAISEVGGGAASGTNISIVPWIIGQTTNGGVGNSLVTYVDAATGLRPLDLSTEYIVDSATLSGVLTDNIRYATTQTTTTPTAINSLVLDSTAAAVVLTGGASAMEITSGTILAAGDNAGTITGFTEITTGGGRDYTFFTTGTGTLTIAPALTSAVALVKSGQGTLSLTSSGNLFTDVYLNQGLLLIDGLDKVNGTTNTLHFFGGGLQLAAGFTDDLTTKPWDINTGGGTLDISLVTAGVTLVNGIDDTTPDAADTLDIFTRNSASGSVGQLTIQGSSTFIGTVVVRNSNVSSTAAGIVLNGDTNAAINGNLILGNEVNINNGFDAVVKLGADEQIVDTATIAFRGASGEDGYFILNGFTETVAGIIGSDPYGVIQNQATNAGKLIVNSGSDFSYQGYLRDTTGTLAFEKQGAGTQTLIDNTTNFDRIIYTGATTITGGTLRLVNANGFASDITNNSQLVLERGTGADWTLAKSISGTGNVTKLGDGTVILGGGNSYSGQTDIEAGVLSISASNNLGDGSATNTVRIANGATLQNTGASVDLGANRGIALAGAGASIEVTDSNVLTASGVISGDDCTPLTKIGLGTLVLTAANTYGGGTVVSAGTLEVNTTGGSGTGTGAVMVSGGRLSGSGIIAGNAIIGNGAVLAPGEGDTDSSNKTLTFTAANTAVEVQDGGQIQLGLASSTQIDGGFDWTTTTALAYLNANGGTGGTPYTTIWGAAGSTYDSIQLTNGTFTLGDTSGGTIRLINSSNYTMGTIFKLLDWSGLGTGTLLDAGGFNPNASNNLDFAVVLDAGLAWDTTAFTTYGVIVVVPEPSRILLIMLGLVGLMLRRRRK